VKGVHFERWRHAMGCGKWFLAARDTATLEVFGTYPAQTTEPPADIVAAIRPNARIGRPKHEHASGQGGRLIDRSTKVDFTFNGKRFSGHPGDTLASALMANGQRSWAGRSSITARAASWPPAGRSPTRW
jgi:hypothetical protein